MTTARSLLLASLLSASISGCGGGAPGSPSAEEDPGDRAVAEEEIDRVTEALGEPSCGSTAADAVLNLATGQSVFSPNGNYDHPTCRNGFVVDVPGLQGGRQFNGGPLVERWPDPFTCLFNWGYLSLWKKQPNGTYTKIQEASRLGVWGPFPGVGYVCGARVGVQALESGDYKLVSSGGTLFGPHAPVQVY